MIDYHNHHPHLQLMDFHRSNEYILLQSKFAYTTFDESYE